MGLKLLLQKMFYILYIEHTQWKPGTQDLKYHAWETETTDSTSRFRKTQDFGMIRYWPNMLKTKQNKTNRKIRKQACKYHWENSDFKVT